MNLSTFSLAQKLNPHTALGAARMRSKGYGTCMSNLLRNEATYERYKLYKWKNHFYEMKGDVGMSVHEKERKQEDAYTKTQTHS